MTGLWLGLKALLCLAFNVSPPNPRGGYRLNFFSRAYYEQTVYLKSYHSFCRPRQGSIQPSEIASHKVSSETNKMSVKEVQLKPFTDQKPGTYVQRLLM